MCFSARDICQAACLTRCPSSAGSCSGCTCITMLIHPNFTDLIWLSCHIRNLLFSDNRKSCCQIKITVIQLSIVIHRNLGLIRNEVVAHLFEDELKNGMYKWALVKLIIVVPAVYVICSLVDLIRSKVFDCVKRVAARFCVE